MCGERAERVAELLNSAGQRSFGRSKARLAAEIRTNTYHAESGDLVVSPVRAKAIAAVEAGGVAVVDVRVQPGYTAAVTAAMTRK